MNSQAGGVVQLVEYLLNLACEKPCVPSLALYKLEIVAHAVIQHWGRGGKTRKPAT